MLTQLIWWVDGLAIFLLWLFCFYVATAKMPLVHEVDSHEVYSNMDPTQEDEKLTFPDGSWIDLEKRKGYKTQGFLGFFRRIMVKVDERLIYLTKGLRDF